jgi:hypothetical protein
MLQAAAWHVASNTTHGKEAIMVALVRFSFVPALLLSLGLSLAIAAEPTRQETPYARLDTGIAGSKNFTVIAPRGDGLADRVLSRADELRKEIALAWLGEELPEGQGLTHITVKLAKDKDEGLTWLCGPGRAVRGAHRMWLETTAERAVGSTLEHEVTHIVLAVRFPKGTPAWANEGIASLADDEERHRTRRELLRQWARTGQWPSLDKVLYQRTISPSDQAGYAAAVSLTEFLLTKGDRREMIDFLEQSAQDGWDAALAKHYGIANVGELQRQWQQWGVR